MNEKMIEMSESQGASSEQIGAASTSTAVSFSDNAVVAAQTQNLLYNADMMNKIAKIAKIYSGSTMVPTAYQNKAENCFVAVELASRMNVSPTLVMQNLAVVQGKPSWSGQACIALVNGSGKFAKELEFITVGTQGQDDWGCRCEAIRKSDGSRLVGSTITIDIAKKEGWYGKNGSKWQTMPEQMLKYRAASFFARIYCPEALMGFSTADEAEDIAKPQEKAVVKISC